MTKILKIKWWILPILIICFFISVRTVLATTIPLPPISCIGTGGTSINEAACETALRNCWQHQNCSGLACTSADSCGHILSVTSTGLCTYYNPVLADYLIDNYNLFYATSVYNKGGTFEFNINQQTLSACAGTLSCEPTDPPALSTDHYKGTCKYTYTPPPSGAGDMTEPVDIYNPVIFNPQVTIPGSEFIKGADIGAGELNTSKEVIESNLVQKYIVAIYNYGLSIVGILAAIMLMIGGLVWITSEGNAGKVDQAKSFIGSSLAGLFLVLTSFLLLRAVNPDLVTLKPLETKRSAPIILGCCAPGGSITKAEMMTKAVCTDKGGTYDYSAMPSSDGKECKKIGCCYASQRTLSTGEMKYACVPTSVEQCPSENAGFGDLVYSSTFMNGSCLDLPTCAGKVASCANADDGDICSVVDFGNCYSGKCYLMPGKDGEQCGNQEGSTCTTKGSVAPLLLDPNCAWQALGIGKDCYNCDSPLSTDGYGPGRRCVDGTYCCYQD